MVDKKIKNLEKSFSEPSSKFDKKRRLFLIISTSILGFIGAIFASIPFIKSWKPSAKAKASGAPVEVDISELKLGQLMVVEWRGKPVWILHRSKEDIANLTKTIPLLSDPDSNKSSQPKYIPLDNSRAIKPQYVVLIGICTHLGCSPTYKPVKKEVDAEVGANWLGGFYCPCHGSKFDLSGRVFKNVPAPDNLVIPPYRYKSDNILIIGEDTV